TLLALGQGNDITSLLRQCEGETGDIDSGKNISHCIREDIVFNIHLIQHPGEGMDIRYLHTDTFAACRIQLPGAQLSYHMSAVDEPVMGGKPGELVKDMAGDQEGDLPFLVQF